MQTSECMACGFSLEGVSIDKCPECGSENVEITSEPEERPKQWDEPGYLKHVNEVCE